MLAVSTETWPAGESGNRSAAAAGCGRAAATAAVRASVATRGATASRRDIDLVIRTRTP